MALFENPVEWLNDDEKIARHIAERNASGFSTFDWWNFDSFYTGFIYDFCRHIVISQSPISDKAAEVYTLIIKARDLERRVDDENDTHEALEIERVQAEVQKEAAALFFTDVIPFLIAHPFPEYDYAVMDPESDAPVPTRENSGFNLEDLRDPGRYALTVFSDGLKNFADENKSHSYPAVPETDSETSYQAWIRELHTQITLIDEMLTKEEISADNIEQLERFIRSYFLSLWD